MQLDALVKPRSVAIVGATDRPSPGRTLVESLGSIGFTGAIYPVNPKYQSILNHTCYPSLMELPEAPDVVVFSIRNPLIPEQVRLAVKRGARAAVINRTFLWLEARPSRIHQQRVGFSPYPNHVLCQDDPLLGPDLRSLTESRKFPRFIVAES